MTQQSATLTVTQKIQAILDTEQASLNAMHSDNNHDDIKAFIKDHATELTGDLEEQLDTLADNSYANYIAEEALNSARNNAGSYDSEEDASEASDNADSEWNYARDELVDTIRAIGFMIEEE